jgi:hypothetical protein
VIVKTVATIGADGVVKGTTRQTATGWLASHARGVGTRIETQGREKAAESQLRTLGQPGTGIFERSRRSIIPSPLSSRAPSA